MTAIIQSSTATIVITSGLVGVATVARAQPEMKHQVHEYVSMLHAGRDEAFNREYQDAHDHYFRLLKE